MNIAVQAGESGSISAPLQTLALSLRGATKVYGGVTALEDVNFDLAPGEVRALIGKNGAGKSTLVKILSGVVSPTNGLLQVGDARASFTKPSDAKAAGIATVHQELSIAPNLTVAENIFLGRWRAVASHGPFLNIRELNRKAVDVLRILDVTMSVTQRCSSLSVAQQQIIEIARAIAERPRVLILDEPTSSLPPSEVSVLLGIIKRLSGEGIAVVFVSHRMDEIPRVADSITVLRDGRHVATGPIAEFSTSRVVDLMTGGATLVEINDKRQPRSPGSCG